MLYANIVSAKMEIPLISTVLCIGQGHCRDLYLIKEIYGYWHNSSHTKATAELMFVTFLTFP